MKSNAETVRRFKLSHVSVLALLTTALLICGATASWAQGEIVGWGKMVIASQDGMANLIAIAAGADHSLGLTPDGSIVSWGSNQYGQCNAPIPNNGFTAIAAGAYYSAGIRAVGAPVANYLVSFQAARQGARAEISWSILRPTPGALFHVWRQDGSRERFRLTALPLFGQDVGLFMDPAPPVGSAEYWLQEVQTGGAEAWYGPAHLGAAPRPSATRLYPCQPNPFNPRTTIKYDLPEAGPVRLTVFDVAGRLVRTLVDESMQQGSHEAVWDGRDSSGREVGSGSYLAWLEFEGKVEAVRMALLR